jgi:hypothetical protein
MIDLLSYDELQQLAASHGGPHLSVYLPTIQNVAGSHQNVIQMKNVMRQAEIQLVEHWMPHRESQEFLAPLLNLTEDEEFWRTMDAGMAIFVHKDEMHAFRLPMSFRHWLSINTEYVIRPIVRGVNQYLKGYVLALSENQVKLYRVDHQSMEPVSVDGLPPSLDSMIREGSEDGSRQLHSGSQAIGGRVATVFHGHGGIPDSRKKEFKKFFRSIDAAVASELRDATEPMILACVDSCVALYHEVNSYAGLRKPHVSGSGDEMELKELHRHALKLLEQEHLEARRKNIERIKENLDTPIATTKIREVVRGAYEGRVHTLLFDETARLEGRFDRELNTVHFLQECRSPEFRYVIMDLIEDVIRKTLLNGGEVIPATREEMPSQSPFAALFRYGFPKN